MNSENYLQINKQTWNNKVSIHVASDFYEQENFLKGKITLPKTDLEALGDVSGKRILHLQCHFGQDSLSLARLGANVTGLDFSEEAIAKAKELNEKLSLAVEFICCDVYDTLQHITEKYDIVYTSYGTIGWLPDLDKWAAVISGALNPKGKLVFFEFHPVVWMFDTNFNEVYYNYFKSEPILEEETGTYANRNIEVTYQTITWNHSLSEVFQSLLKQNITIKNFKEFDYSNYNCFSQTEEVEPGKYRIKKFGNKIPMMYSIVGELKL